MLVAPKVEATPLWLLFGPKTPVPLLDAADRKLPPADLRSAPGPDRHPLRGAAGGLPRTVLQHEHPRILGNHPASGDRRARNPVGEIPENDPFDELVDGLAPDAPALPSRSG